LITNKAQFTVADMDKSAFRRQLQKSLESNEINFHDGNPGLVNSLAGNKEVKEQSLQS
jgi:hypothetical protein